MKLDIGVRESEVIHHVYTNKIEMPISIDDYAFEVIITYEEELGVGKVLKHIDIKDEEKCHTVDQYESFDDILLYGLLILHYKDKMSDEKFRKELEDISNNICKKVDKIISDNEIMV